MREAVQSLWAVVPGRSKDYIAGALLPSYPGCFRPLCGQAPPSVPAWAKASLLYPALLTLLRCGRRLQRGPGRPGRRVLAEAEPGRLAFPPTAAPKDNGYQSLHATLRVPMGGCASPVGEEGDAAATASEDGSAGGASTTLELQIRTLGGWALTPLTCFCGRRPWLTVVRAAAGTLRGPSSKHVGSTLPQQVCCPCAACPSQPAACRPAPPLPPAAAMHEAAEMGAAAHAAYKGGLAASQARQLRAWTDARRLLAERSDAAAAAATAQQGGPEAGAAAAEVLFRHLDLNGDGRISLCELRAALQELGVAGAGGQVRALLAGQQRSSACSARMRCLGLAH